MELFGRIETGAAAGNVTGFSGWSLSRQLHLTVCEQALRPGSPGYQGTMGRK
jgi:hypothetical protein